MLSADEIEGARQKGQHSTLQTRVAFGAQGLQKQCTLPRASVQHIQR